MLRCRARVDATIGQSIPNRFKLRKGDFDKSIKGDAYFDTDPSNNGGAYRQTGVDVQPCSEGGYNIGWMIDHEWMQYTVHVERTGSYDILCRVGSPKDTASFHIEVNDQDKTGRLVVPNTGDWQRYTNVVARGVQLSAGEHIMRVVVDTDGFNLNYLEITHSDR